MDNFFSTRTGKLFIGFLCLLFLINLVSSAPPVSTVQQFTEGFVLKYPPQQTLQQNKPFEFEVHVFNVSNGVPITSGVGCYFHLYNNTGKHQLELYDDAVSHNFDYSFDLTAGNFSRAGEYAYIVQCNNSALGGFVEVDFDVTSDGNSLINSEISNDSKMKFLWLIIILAVGFIAIGLWKSEKNITMLGNILLFAIGLYTTINGIGAYKNSYTTIFSLTLIGLALVITAKVMEGWLDNLNNV